MTQDRAVYLANIAAITASKYAQKIRGARIGAIATYRKGLFPGWNRKVTHPKQLLYSRNPHSIYLHAEIDALIASDWRAESLVVVRILANGQLSLAKPCQGCIRALDNLDEVWYSDDTGNIIKL